MVNSFSGPMLTKYPIYTVLYETRNIPVPGCFLDTNLNSVTSPRNRKEQAHRRRGPSNDVGDIASTDLNSGTRIRPNLVLEIETVFFQS